MASFSVTSRYTGKERDAESGNDYFGARYYGSSMGRFMSPDPSELTYANPANPQSLNLYAYVLNNPLKNIDPTGLDCVYLSDDFKSIEEVDADSDTSDIRLFRFWWNACRGGLVGYGSTDPDGTLNEFSPMLTVRRITTIPTSSPIRLLPQEPLATSPISYLGSGPRMSTMMQATPPRNKCKYSERPED